MSDPIRSSTVGALPRRKPYKTPKLRSYGNISDITRDIGAKGGDDGFGPTKPHGVKNTSI